MEKQLKCPWCGHEKCPKCQKDKWAELRDGCCQCKAKIIETLEGTKRHVCVYLTEMPSGT